MVVNDFKLNFDLNGSSRLFKLWYSVKFELPMASFFKYICSFFARNFVVGFMLQCFYVPILFSRLFLRSKSVQKCSTAQSFTFPKFTSFKLGTLVRKNPNIWYWHWLCDMSSFSWRKWVTNVWCIKFRSKHSSNTVLCLLRNLMHQTL